MEASDIEWQMVDCHSSVKLPCALARDFYKGVAANPGPYYSIAANESIKYV